MIPLKILQVVHSFIPYTIAGTEVYAYALSKELAKKNEVAVFFRVNRPQEKEYSLIYERFEGLDTYAVNHTFNQCSSFEETYSDKNIDQLFGKLLDRIKPDVIHIQHLLFLSLGIIKEAKERNIPIVFTLNDYWLFCHRGQLIKNDLSICKGYSISNCSRCLESQLSINKNTIFFYNIIRNNFSNAVLQLAKKIYLFFAKTLFLGLDKTQEQVTKRYDFAGKIVSQIALFIAPSGFIKQRFVEFGVPGDKIVVCRYGIDRKNFQWAPKNVSERLRFGFIGTLLPMKGPDILISAFKRINKRDIELFIYGKSAKYAGYENYYKQLKKMAQGDSRVKFMGEFYNKEIGKILKNIDILVVPSIWQENAPLVIQEAILSNIPVIASRIGGIPELVNDSINGLLFNPADSEDLQEKLEYAINSPDIIKRFKEEAPDIKTIEDNAKEIEGLYNSLLEAKPRAN